MENKFSRIPTKDEFNRLIFKIKTIIADKHELEIGENTENLVIYLSSYYQNVDDLYDSNKKKDIESQYAYQWLTSDPKSQINKALDFVLDKNAHNYEKQANKDISDASVKSGQMDGNPNILQVAQRQDRFFKRLEKIAKSHIDRIAGRERLISVLCRIMVNIYYNKQNEDSICTENQLKNDVEKVVNSLQEAKNNYKELAKYKQYSIDNYRDLKIAIHDAIRATTIYRLPFIIKRDRGRPELRKAVIQLANYFIKNGGISISNVCEGSTEEDLSKNRQGENPIAVYLLNGKIVFYELETTNDLSKKLEGIDLSEDDLEVIDEWKCGERFFQVDRTNYRYAIAEIVNAIGSILEFLVHRLTQIDSEKGVVENEEWNQGNIREIVKHEILKNAIQNEIKRRLALHHYVFPDNEIYLTFI